MQQQQHEYFCWWFSVSALLLLLLRCSVILLLDVPITCFFHTFATTSLCHSFACRFLSFLFLSLILFLFHLRSSRFILSVSISISVVFSALNRSFYSSVSDLVSCLPEQWLATTVNNVRISSVHTNTHTITFDIYTCNAHTMFMLSVWYCARVLFSLQSSNIYGCIYILGHCCVGWFRYFFFLLLFVCFFSFFIVPNILIESLQYIYTSLPIEHTLCSIQNCCWNTNNITKISFRILLNKLLYFFRMGFSLLLLLYFFFALSVSLGSFSSRVCACVSFALYPVYSLSFSLDLCIYIFVQFVVD